MDCIQRQWSPGCKGQLTEKRRWVQYYTKQLGSVTEEL